MKFKYMYKSDCMADVEFNIRNNTVTVLNHTNDLINRPFGRSEHPDMNDLEEFLESRCFPRARANCAQLLADLKLPVYDPPAIVMATYGRQWDDYNWILFEGEEADYDRDVKLRD